MSLALNVIQPHPTWSILDSSKLSTYMSCPRKFSYQYVLGWRPDYPNNHLIFGSAWHLALEHLTLHQCNPDELPEAFELFNAFYREFFPDSTDELYEPKTPAKAAEALMRYAQSHRSEAQREEVLYTELGGLVMVSATRTMTFKCDAIIRQRDGSIIGRDYKTSGRKFSNWGDHWTLSTQMLTYLHSLHCLYPDAPELSMQVRCAWFYKKSPTDFGDHPIRKSLPQMQAWLERTNQWIDRMMVDRDILENEDDTDAISMQSYPQNDTACFNFGTQCAFFDFCNTWANPLSRCEQTPLGFRTEWWDPMAAPEIRTKVDLTQPEGVPSEKA